jgi:hypothetical protein
MIVIGANLQTLAYTTDCLDGRNIQIGKCISQRSPPCLGVSLPYRLHLIPCLPQKVRLFEEMLEIFFQSCLGLLRLRFVTTKPPITSCSLDNLQSLHNLFSMPDCGIRNSMDTVILFANGRDDLVPEEAVEP